MIVSFLILVSDCVVEKNQVVISGVFYFVRYCLLLLSCNLGTRMIAFSEDVYML